jgi:hypothetical protein
MARRGSPESFKFDWQRAVLEDNRVSATRARVLTYCALQYPGPGKITFSVRQETVAKKLHLHVDTVADAFGCARRLGWLVLEREREHGRGKLKGDTHRLTFPQEIPGPASGYLEEEMPGSGSGYNGEIPGPGSGKYPEETQEIPGRPNAATSQNGDPGGGGRGFTTGVEKNVGGLAPPSGFRVFDPNNPSPPPPLFCDDHPNDTEQPCRRCKAARQTNELWWQEKQAYEGARESAGMRNIREIDAIVAKLEEEGAP